MKKAPLRGQFCSKHNFRARKYNLWLPWGVGSWSPKLTCTAVWIVTTPSQGHPLQSLRLLECLVSSLRLLTERGNSVDSDGQCGKTEFLMLIIVPQRLGGHHLKLIPGTRSKTALNAGPEKQMCPERGRHPNFQSCSCRAHFHLCALMTFALRCHSLLCLKNLKLSKETSVIVFHW